ncbi:MAG: hypothetical protein AB7E60_00805 [Sphingobium sp.]
MRRLPITAPAALLLLLTACGPASDAGVGGVSASEASALNDAAAMLDAQAGRTQEGNVDLNPAARAAASADRGRIQSPVQDRPTP